MLIARHVPFAQVVLKQEVLMKTLLNAKGFSLVEAMIGLGALSLTATVMLNFANTQRLFASKNSSQTALTSLRENILNTIVNQPSWDRTKTMNASLACMSTYPSTCPDGFGGDINIYTSNGTLLVDSLNPSSGFTLAGKPCTGYSAQGNDLCPLKASVSWQARCSGIEGCKFPQEVISVNFVYSPAQQRQITNFSNFNVYQLSRRNLSENASPTTICSSAGRIYIGSGNLVQDGQGIPTEADQNGCVPVQAFRGARGAQGAQGGRGPTGAPGIVITGSGGGGGGYSGGSTASAMCSANPWICASYNTVLNRNPEVGGVTFWEGDYSSCLNSGGTPASCQKIVEDRIKVAAIPELTGDTAKIEAIRANWEAATGTTGSKAECITGQNCTNVDTSQYQVYMAWCAQTGKCNL